MSLHLTSEDLLILEKQRLDRFRSFFHDSLSFCFLYLDRHSRLKIHCSEPWVVDLLLAEMEQLCWYGWVIVGAHHLSIYYAAEKIYSTKTQTFVQRYESSQDFPVTS